STTTHSDVLAHIGGIPVEEALPAAPALLAGVTVAGSRLSGGSGRGVSVLHGGRERLGALLRRRRVHPHDLPAVAVEVEETACVHETEVLGAIRLGAD